MNSETQPNIDTSGSFGGMQVRSDAALNTSTPAAISGATSATTTAMAVPEPAVRFIEFPLAWTTLCS